MNYENLIKLLGPDEAEFLREELEKPKPYSSLYTFEEKGIYGWLLTMRTMKTREGKLSFDVEYFLFFDGNVYPFDISANDLSVMTPLSWIEFIEDLEDRLEKDRDIFYIYYDETEALEDQYYQRNFSSGLLSRWFDLKKDTSRIDRFFGRLESTYRDLYRVMEKHYPGRENDIQYLSREAHVLHENVEGLIGRLDNANNYYSSLKNERLNRNIYFLTVLSGIFLPLNLIVGFFGMNTEGLFFKDHPNGTMNVVYLLAGIFFAFVLGSSVIKLFDRLFIKWWLGKTKFHSTVIQKLESIEENWKA